MAKTFKLVPMPPEAYTNFANYREASRKLAEIWKWLPENPHAILVPGGGFLYKGMLIKCLTDGSEPHSGAEADRWLEFYQPDDIPLLAYWPTLDAIHASLAADVQEAKLYAGPDEFWVIEHQGDMDTTVWESVCLYASEAKARKAMARNHGAYGSKFRARRLPVADNLSANINLFELIHEARKSA